MNPVDLPLYRPSLRILLRWTVWTLWALVLASSPAAAESETATGIAPEVRPETSSAAEIRRMARAETLLPERNEVHRVAAEWDDRSGLASEADEDEIAPASSEDSSAEEAPRESEADLPPESASPSRTPDETGEFGDPEEFEDLGVPEDGIVPLVEYAEGRLTVRADGEPLGEVLHQIREAGDIRIQGLNHRIDDPLSFQVENMPAEDALKRLMRHLKENNYAFEYSRTRLRRLSVFPAGQIEVARPAPPPRPRGDEAEAGRERVVRVINVQEGTQAENLDLRQGDLIVEYDGEAINSAQQLVNAVKGRSAEQVVQMTVVRDGNRFPLTLNGGLIGINILTVNVPPEALGR